MPVELIVGQDGTSRWWRPPKTQAKTPCFRSTRYQIWTSKGCIEFYNNLALPGVWCCVTPFFHLSPGFFTSADPEGACFRGTSSGGEVADSDADLLMYPSWKFCGQIERKEGLRLLEMEMEFRRYISIDSEKHFEPDIN